jgi:uncharacterized protein with gpF-like domain
MDYKMPELEDLTFEQAVKFFRGKVPLTRPEFNRLIAEAKRRAFTVATILKMDILKDIQDAVAAAIESGSTLAEFNARLFEIMEERGWRGTTPWHAETIFRTNIQSAYGSGRYEQQQELAELYPFAEYVAVLDGREREDHGALHGTIAPIDSEFWVMHYPPWDYN